MSPSISPIAALSLLAGGLGLFLLGMTMMTDGLKLAAGAALHRILRGATRTRWHALGSGALITALVQSSSAVTVAAIGFVNAGLLGLAPALWVLFGANVGTTMTGWIVALVGLKFKVEALALPLVGLGALMRLGAEGQRRGAFGTTLAGFGLLFLGIATMQQAFAGLSGQVSLPQGTGVLTVLSQLGIGLAMTVLMQSSSASMTVAITAAQGGLIDAQGAAAVVIGANVGTTVKALLAAIGATPNARRAAAAHVVFNGLTGVVALLLLPWLIGALGMAREALGLPADPAAKLALFHTTFNVLGVLLMWPLADGLTRWLQQRFRAREEDAGQPQHLDDTVLAVPTLALDALAREVARLGQFALATVRGVCKGQAAAELGHHHAVVRQLDSAVESFVERMNRAAMPQAGSARLALLLQVKRHHETASEQALAAAPMPEAATLGHVLAERQAEFLAQTDSLLSRCAAVDSAAAAGHARAASEPAPDLPVQGMEAAYVLLKAEALAAGADGRLTLAQMESALGRYSALRRAAQQSVAARELPHTGVPS